MKKGFDDGILNKVLSQMRVPDTSKGSGVSHSLETLHQSSVGFTVACLCCLNKVRYFFHSSSSSSKIFYDRGAKTGRKTYLHACSTLACHSGRIEQPFSTPQTNTARYLYER